MIKRIFVIGCLTGAAYLSTVLVLKKLTASLPITAVKSVGTIDAQFNLIFSILAAGLLMTSAREIAISENWRQHYISGQEARITLSFLLCIFSLVGIYHNEYYFLAGAPFIALNGDYLLYAKGRPVTASLLAFLKVFVPSMAMFLAAVYWQQYVVWIFALTTIIMYFFSGLVISWLMKFPYWFTPKLSSLRSYLSTLYLGVVSFSYYFLGLGLIIVADLFYPGRVIAHAYLALKVYVIYKGVLRIIVQAFFSEMMDEDVSIKVDRLSILTGLAFLISASLFPSGFLSLFVDKSLVQDFSWIFLIGINGFLFSPFLSLTTRAILEKKDKAYAGLVTIAMLVSTLTCIIFSFSSASEKTIIISLGLGEFIASAGLIIILKKLSLVKERLLFIAMNLPLLAIPGLMVYFLGDSFFTFIIFLFVFSAAALLLNRNQFKMKPKISRA